MSQIPVADILGIKVSIIDLPVLLREIDCYAGAGRAALVNNVNVHACNIAYEQPAFRDVLNASDLVFCDGFGVKLGAVILGKKLGQRMTPPDWIDDLFSLCVDKDYSVYFLGDTEAVVDLFSNQVQKIYPALKVAGWHQGFFESQGVENDEVIKKVTESGADIVITGMGMPRQELWAAEAKDRIGRGVFIATGALFRWYTGYEKRMPRWITDHGLEWLARLITSPKRHFKRYVAGLPLFFLRIIRQRFSAGKTSDE